MAANRVVHLTPALFGAGGVFGGAERYTLELARHMARRTPTRLVTFGEYPERRRTEDGLEIVVLAPYWKVRGQAFNRLHPGLLRQLAGAHVIHCHQTKFLSSSLSAFVARLTGRRVFTSDLGAGGWDISAYHPTDRWFHAHLHISEYSKRLASHPLGVEARVILGGVDIERFSPSPSGARFPQVVFVGRLMAHKGVDQIIRALPDGLRLLLIGRPYQADYLQHLQGLSVGKQVRFIHDASDEVIIQAYRESLAVVLPSVYRDCFGKETLVPELLGQTLLEGMACGTPGIATRVASLPEIVDDGVTGYLFEAGDIEALRMKLVFLRDRPLALGEMGRAARKRVVDHFHWDHVVDRCLRAYASRDASTPPGQSCV